MHIANGGAWGGSRGLNSNAFPFRATVGARTFGPQIKHSGLGDDACRRWCNDRDPVHRHRLVILLTSIKAPARLLFGVSDELTERINVLVWHQGSALAMPVATA